MCCGLFSVAIGVVGFLSGYGSVLDTTWFVCLCLIECGWFDVCGVWVAFWVICLFELSLLLGFPVGFEFGTVGLFI